MSSFDLSIICPTVNPDRLVFLYNGLIKSVGKYKFQLIAVGPHFPDKSLEKASNFVFLREFSSPSVAFMAGASIARGKYIAFVPDDVSFDELGFERVLDFMEDKPRNHGMTLRYDEGGQGQAENKIYWVGHTHQDQQLKGINENWKIAPCFLYNREYFIEIGGLDTSLEHVNLNGHSVAYFTQANGGEMHPSPTRIFSAGWQPPTESTVLYQAYLENDAPKFKAFWDKKDAVLDYKVDFDNWKKQPIYWPRRYKNE